jgi:hypothetical protein
MKPIPNKKPETSLRLPEGGWMKDRARIGSTHSKRRTIRASIRKSNNPDTLKLNFELSDFSRNGGGLFSTLERTKGS